jgi:hypothetical protein
MASDGLWDVISSQEAVQIVATEANKLGWSGEQLVTISHKLCTEAFRRGSMDNITVAVVMALPDIDRSSNIARNEAGSKRNSNSNSHNSQHMNGFSNANGTLEQLPQRVTKGSGQSASINGSGSPLARDVLQPQRDANAADHWSNGSSAPRKKDMLAMLRPHVSGNQKTLLQNAGRGTALGRVLAGAADHSASNGNSNKYMEHGSRAARANSLHQSFSAQQQQQQAMNGGTGLLPPTNKNTSLPAASNGYASAWGKDGGRSLRQMPVNKRAEMLSSTLRASFY